jgi:predicted metal-dependent HD superfamily phosphohydrolase
MKATRERWVKLCKVIKAKNNPITGRTIDNTYDELLTAYTGPDRHYHNLDHINDGLELIDKTWHLAENPDALEMAWWWHDFVYRIPTKETGPVHNELESAIYAFKALSKLNVNHLICAKVMARIMPTLHTYIPDYIDDRVIVDIDLVSLGYSPDIFEANAGKIRKEYGASAEEFRIGRVNFFRKFLDGRPSIYLTKYFHERYETQAHKNIRDYLAKFGTK